MRHNLWGHIYEHNIWGSMSIIFGVSRGTTAFITLQPWVLQILIKYQISLHIKYRP